MISKRQSNAALRRLIGTTTLPQQKPPTPVYPTRIMEVFLPGRNPFRLLWKQKYGTWFLIGSPRETAGMFKEILTESGFLWWAKREQAKFQWLEDPKTKTKVELLD